MKINQEISRPPQRLSIRTRARDYKVARSPARGKSRASPAKNPRRPHLPPPAHHDTIPAAAIAELAGLLSHSDIRAAVRRVLKQRQVREQKPRDSLRGAPHPTDITQVWHCKPRSMMHALRLGSRLLDLEPTVDNSLIWKITRSGRRKIIARNAGIKGWLRTHCPSVKYASAMRYKKLASRLRTVCEVKGNIPLEWLLPNAKNPEKNCSENVKSAVAKGRRILTGILKQARSLRQLGRLLDLRLKIIRIPRKMPSFSVISQQGGGHDAKPAKSCASTAKISVTYPEKSAVGHTRKSSQPRKAPPTLKNGPSPDKKTKNLKFKQPSLKTREENAAKTALTEIWLVLSQTRPRTLGPDIIRRMDRLVWRGTANA